MHNIKKEDTKAAVSCLLSADPTALQFFSHVTSCLLPRRCRRLLGRSLLRPPETLPSVCCACKEQGPEEHQTNIDLRLSPAQLHLLLVLVVDVLQSLVHQAVQQLHLEQSSGSQTHLHTHLTCTAEAHAPSCCRCRLSPGSAKRLQQSSDEFSRRQT